MIDYPRWHALFDEGPLGFAVAVAAGLLLSWLVHALLHAALRRLTKDGAIPRRICGQVRPVTRWLLPAFVVRASLPLLGDGQWLAYAREALDVAIVMLFTWVVVRAVRGLELGFAARYPIDVVDNLHARQVQTQARVLARSAQTVAWTIGVAIALMTLPGVREIGASLLASAGVAGVVLGFAAKPVLGNLIAGIQLALTQPIRIDDEVVVNGEFGRVEEIGSSFICVKLWDERRLLVPLTWFIENCFENWTRRSSEITGEVAWWVDFSVPVDAIREEAQRIVEADPRWDGRTVTTVVLESGDRAMKVRTLVSARNSGDLSDLRYAVREGVLAYLQRRFPQALPRVRSELRVEGAGGRDVAAAFGGRGGAPSAQPH
ncbi:MAG TPA: mechanosensitive ion channel domain-containing protein [Xanthomonadales bacterium]|nr:mechanosensitive ion channel domain-containing protein [Xanthomonadales bacterium]